MRPGSTRVAVRALLAVLVAIVQLETAYATEVGYRLGLSSEYSDNIGRTETDETSESISRFEAAAQLYTETYSITSDTTFHGTYRDYLRDVYEDRTDYSLNTANVWHLLPQRIDVHIDDYADRIRINTSEPDTPDNLQYTNLLSIGPTINIQKGGDSLVLDGRYLNSYYETSDTDNFSGIAIGRYRRQITPVSRVSINYAAKGIKYKNPKYSTFITQQATVGYDRTASPRTRFMVELGGTKVDNRADPNDDTTGATGNIDLLRQITRDSSLRISIGKEYTTAGQTLAADIRGQELRPDTFTPGDLFLLSSARARYERTNVYGSQRIGLRARDIEYEHALGDIVTDATSDQTIRGGDITLTYNLVSDKVAGFDAYYTKTEYLETFRTDRDMSAETWLEQRINRNLGLRMTYAIRKRSSSDLDEEFIENRGMISLYYALGYPSTARRDRALEAASQNRDTESID